MNTEKIKEILVITQEEAAEVIQVISKMQRFGIGAVYLREGENTTNIDALHKEVGDLLCMIDLLQSHGLLNKDILDVAKAAKTEKLKRWSTIFDKDD